MLFRSAGNKLDLRGAGSPAVDAATARNAGMSLGADAYMECSARNDVGVAELFEAAARRAKP